MQTNKQKQYICVITKTDDDDVSERERFASVVCWQRKWEGGDEEWKSKQGRGMKINGNSKATVLKNNEKYDFQIV